MNIDDAKKLSDAYRDFYAAHRVLGIEPPSTIAYKTPGYADLMRLLSPAFSLSAGVVRFFGMKIKIDGERE